MILQHPPRSPRWLTTPPAESGGFKGKALAPLREQGCPDSRRGLMYPRLRHCLALTGIYLYLAPNRFQRLSTSGFTFSRISST